MVYYLLGLCLLILAQYPVGHFSGAPPAYCSLAAFKHFLSGAGEMTQV